MKKLINVFLAFYIFNIGMGLATAQTPPFPQKPVTMVVPWAAGGGTDNIARKYAQRLQTLWGQTVVIENVPGAGSVIGAQRVARAKPDGYTIGQLAISVTRFAQLGMVQIDPLKDYKGTEDIFGRKKLF